MCPGTQVVVILVLEFFVGALVCPCCRWVGRVWFRQNCMIKMYTYRRISKRFGMCSDITYSPINSVDFDCRYHFGWVYTLAAVGIVLLFHYYTEMVVRVCIILEYDCPLQFLVILLACLNYVSWPSKKGIIYRKGTLTR